MRRWSRASPTPVGVSPSPHGWMSSHMRTFASLLLVALLFIGLDMSRVARSPASRRVPHDSGRSLLQPPHDQIDEGLLPQGTVEAAAAVKVSGRQAPPPVNKIQVKPNKLPDYVFLREDIPGLDLYGAYWKAPGNKVVFSGQCFDQGRTPDFCAVYSKANTTLCSALGEARQMAGGIVDCILPAGFDCPEELLPLMGVVGNRDRYAVAAEVEDYREPSGQQSPYLGLCTMFKLQSQDPEVNQRRWLEWLTYHELVGVEHFYLYNHGSDPKMLKHLMPVFKHYQRRGMLTLRHVPFSKTCYIGRTSSEGTDSWAFSDCVARYSGIGEWMAFPDADEFIYPGDGYETVTALLREKEPEENILAIYMPWTIVGSSGHQERPAGTLMENFVHVEAPRCSTGSSVAHENHCTGKVLGRLDRMGYLIFPHLVDYDISRGQWGPDTHPDWWSRMDMAAMGDRIRFNRPEPSNAYCKEGNKCMWCPQPGEGLACWHYWCQSAADFKEKVTRGCVGECGYDMRLWDEQDRKSQMVDTRMKDRFAARVAALMEQRRQEVEDERQAAATASYAKSSLLLRS